jgi:hypothetical protein
MFRVAKQSAMGTLAVIALLSPLVLNSTGAAVASPQTAAPATGRQPMVALGTGLTVPVDPAHRSKAQEDAYRNEIARLDLLGKLDPSTLARMGLQRISNPAPTEHIVAASTAQLRRAPAACRIWDAATSAGGIALPAPTIWLNGSSQGYRLYASAKYKWTNPPDGPFPCTTAVGGPDGFAMSLSKSVVNKGVSFYTCSSVNKCQYTYGWLETNSSYGAGYAFQDRAGAALNGFFPAYSGSIVYAFMANPSQCVQAFSKYGHTWNSTSVNGFSIGPWSIGVQWSSSAAHWQKASQSGSYHC